MGLRHSIRRSITNSKNQMSHMISLIEIWGFVKRSGGGKGVIVNKLQDLSLSSSDIEFAAALK